MKKKTRTLLIRLVSILVLITMVTSGFVVLFYK